MDDQHICELKKEVIVEERFCFDKEKELTVHKTSMFSQGDGFIVYDTTGDILFRVDLYGPIKHRLLLMDAFGKPLLTLIPKRPTLHQRWEGFLGEKSNMTNNEQSPPIFCIRKSTIIGRSNMIVEVYNRPHKEYQIEGCFKERSCTIFHVSSPEHDTSKRSMAQIKRKVEPTRKIVLGRDVFTLVLKPGFDAAFAMGLVLVLDRIDDDEISPIIECHNNKDIGTTTSTT